MTVGIKKNSAFARMAREDPQVVKITTARESGRYLVDTKALVKELVQMHSVKRSRTDTAAEMLNKRSALTSRVLETQALRSRAISIKIECFQVVSDLDEQLKYLTKHLATAYNAQLSSEFSTAKARNDAVSVALQDFTETKAAIDRVQHIADLVITDLDATGYSNNNLTRLFDILRRVEQ